LRALVYALGPAARFQMTPQVRTAPGVVSDQDGVDVSAGTRFGVWGKMPKRCRPSLLFPGEVKQNNERVRDLILEANGWCPALVVGGDQPVTLRK
jgi:hypothetical protein